MTNNPTHIYELVDCSEFEDGYQTVGVWLSKEDAMKAIDDIVSPEDIGSPLEHDETFRVELRERKVGWGDNDKVVFSRLWVMKYDEETDESKWEVQEAT